ncbi:MAG: CDP-6-deoxy-delta-3,4-glucoseen reductase [Pseudomonadota bacterium]|nr:CDP-6-deoxy-delta-3,4-glucoseen reductase [Pseudomonadota bacterium]
MTFQITVQPSGHHFECELGETLLAAAIRAGIGLPYGCKNGACGSCKGKVVAGAVSHKAYQQRALSDQEAADGFALFCCATTEADLVVEAREVAGSSEYPVRKMPARVAKLDKVAPDVIVMSLQLPANEALAYRAGQYIEFMLKDGKRRAYSLANAPSTLDAPLQIHIRYMAGGLFTEQVFTTMKERDIVRFEGPHGSFFLREDSDKPIVLLASGTGFAPVKALVEHLLHLKSTRPVSLYWGGRRPHDLYMHELCEQWAAIVPNFRYVPVVSDALPEDHWTGRTGFVHAAVMADLPDLSGHQVYACGAPIMVDSAQRDFGARCALPADEFYADAFTSEADLAQP